LILYHKLYLFIDLCASKILFLNNDISFKQINKLAIPALISGVSEPILSLTDAAIVGHVPYNATASLAAVGIVTTFLSMLIWVFGQTRSALSSIISQYLGAHKLEEIKSLPAQAIFIITSISILIIAITYPFAKHIFKLYNASGFVLSYSVSYYKIRVLGFPFTLFVMAIFGTFRGLQNTFYPMVIAIVGALINIVLDYVFVYGITGYLTAMHIKGAAYASVISQGVMALCAVCFFIKKTDFSLRVVFPLNKEMKRFVGMIINLFIRTIALNVTLYFASAYATSYGASYIAAYTIAINLWFLGAFIIDGYASAGNILSGKYLGSKNYAALLKLSKRLTKYGIYIGVILCVLGTVLYSYIGPVFTKAPDVLNAFYTVFWLVLIMQPLCSLAFIFDGIFKGLGQMAYLRNVLLFATFAVFLPTLFIFDYFDIKLQGIFFALTFWITARGLPLIIKFKNTFNPLALKTKS